LTRSIHFAALLLLSMLFPVFSVLPAFCESKDISKYVTVPVYYLTDREKKKEGFGSRRRYRAQCLHEMYYGTMFVNVPNKEKLDVNQKEYSVLGWKGASEKTAKVSPKKMIDPADYAAAKAEFLGRIKSALEQSGKPDLCIFVHGACDAFEDCAQDAAMIGYYMQKPVVLYSWPSNPRWRSYFVDGSNNEYSQAHFNMFCKDLCSLQKTTPLNAIMVSHSMGNRIVIRSLPTSYGKGLVSEWNIVSADIDAATCRHYLLGLEPDNSKIRVYVSNKDKMLPLAQILSGGYYRTGEAATKIEIPKLWSDSQRAEFERIDFTAMDTGFDGHSIPFHLIADISRHDKPAVDYELVPETEIRANRLTRFANRAEKLSDTTSGLPAQYCKRVVKMKTKKTAVSK
jgi:esterase/lipase superfamily enzyme